MTRWIANPQGGRDRGPRAVARAWVEALVRPRRFFRVAVAPGDQAPGLTFFVTVVFVAEASRFLLVADAYPPLPVAAPLAGAFWIGLVALLVAPLGLHFVSAVQTLFLAAVVPERATISETVQCLAYGSAPCALAGLPIPALRLLCATYATVLLVVGLATVHGTSYARAAVAGVAPATLVYWVGFRGLDAYGAVAGSVPW